MRIAHVATRSLKNFELCKTACGHFSFESVEKLNVVLEQTLRLLFGYECHLILLTISLVDPVHMQLLEEVQQTVWIIL